MQKMNKFKNENELNNFQSPKIDNSKIKIIKIENINDKINKKTRNDLQNKIKLSVNK